MALGFVIILILGFVANSTPAALDYLIGMAMGFIICLAIHEPDRELLRKLTEEKKDLMLQYNQLEVEVCNLRIKLDPNCDSYYYQRGEIYEKIGEIHKALADYTKAIEIEPCYYYFNKRGDIYRWELQDSVGSEEDYRKARDFLI